MAELHELDCSGKVDRLTDDEIGNHLDNIDDGWKVNEDGSSLHRDFVLGNYDETLTLVNLIAGIAIQQDHHPDISFGYRNCAVTWSTHSVDGLSINDFICAARIDRATAE